MTQLGIPREKVVYIPNGIAAYDKRVSEPNHSAMALLAQIGQLCQAGCIIAEYVGTHVRANGVDSLVALFALHGISTHKNGLSCNRLFDFMASARPAVSACVAENTLGVASSAGICVPSDSPDDIADAPMKSRSMGEAERHAMGERGRHWVYEHNGATALAGRFLGALAQARR